LLFFAVVKQQIDSRSSRDLFCGVFPVVLFLGKVGGWKENSFDIEIRHHMNELVIIVSAIQTQAGEEEASVSLNHTINMYKWLIIIYYLKM
jgi:hypothetical protein